VRAPGGRWRVDVRATALRVASERRLLLPTALAVALTAFLAAAAPGLMAAAADATVRDAVAQAGPAADLTVLEPLTADRSRTQVHPDSAAEVSDLTRTVGARLDTALPGVFGPPRAAVTTGSFVSALARGENGMTSLRLAYVWREGGSGVRWVRGRPPGDTVAGDVVPAVAPPVEVGLTAAVAGALGVDVGDEVPAREGGQAVDVRVTGLFEPADAGDPQWAGTPGLLVPDVSGAGLTTATRLAGLLTAGSLPAARLLGTSTATRSYVLSPDPRGLDDARAVATARAVAALEAAPSVFPGEDGRVAARSGLDDVLLAAHARAAAAAAQAHVLLAAVVLAAAAALWAAADGTVRRRARWLALQHVRGSAPLGTALDLTLESAAVTAVGAGAGVLTAVLATGVAVHWAWVAPVLVVGVLALPLRAVRSSARPASATAGADRRDGRVRRVAAELLVLGAAAAALSLLLGPPLDSAPTASAPLDPTALGLGRAGPPAGVLPGAAVALAALAGALVWRRAAGLLPRAGLAGARRRPGAVPLVAAARRAAARRGAAAVTVVLATAVAAVAATTAATIHAGQAAGSWQAVGADVVVTSPGGDLEAVAATLAAAPGVDLAVPGRVEDGAQFLGRGSSTGVRLVVAAPGDLDRLRRAGGLPGLPPPGDAGPSPAPVLVSGDLRAQLTGTPVLRWSGGDAAVRVSGTTPSLFDAAGRPTAVVDPAALAAASGSPVPADTLWVTGPGAAAAVAATPALRSAQVRERATWLTARRRDPVSRSLLALAVAVVALGGVLAALATALAAVADAPERAQAVARLRALGFSRAAVRRATAAELVPGLLADAVVGSALGVALAAATVGALRWEALTGQTGAPSLVVPPWAAAAAALPLVVAVAVVVGADRRQRARSLGRSLRD